MPNKMRRTFQNEMVCKSCGQPVTSEDTERVGGNFIYWKVYRCKKCLSQRRRWTFIICLLMLLLLFIGFILSR